MSTPHQIEFKRAVVRSVALSILLAKDFAPRSRAPPVQQLVEMEVPRVLAGTLRVPTVRAAVGGLGVRLHQPIEPDPDQLLRDFTQTLTTQELCERATEYIERHGHEDFVFGVLKYTQKASTATSQGMHDLIVAVADVLDVPLDEDTSTRLEGAYAAAYKQLRLT